MKKIIIVWSGSLREKWLERKQWWESKWYVILDYPRKMQETMEENRNIEYKGLYVDFYWKLKDADILFLMNEDKKWIEWYIGAESFAELSFANANNVLGNKQTEIFIKQMPSKDVWCHEEIEFFLKLDWIKILDKDNI